MFILKPFELLLSFVFELSVKITGNYGFSLLIMSIIITVLTTPIYLLADNWSSKEKKLQEKMKPEIDSIKRAFSGQKQYYLIQTTHRIHNYKFFYPLRSMLGILFQIPFFFAAYNVLSSYSGYSGVSWGKIIDLAAPDNLFFGLNFLPFLMTFFNIISSFYYTKSYSPKDNKQQIILALVFLLLLYDSPSALLIYWTSNNFLSLIKNMIIGKILIPTPLKFNFNWKKITSNPNVKVIFLTIIFFASLFLISNQDGYFKYLALVESLFLGIYVLFRFIKNGIKAFHVYNYFTFVLYAITLIGFLLKFKYLTNPARHFFFQVVFLITVISFWLTNDKKNTLKNLIINTFLFTLIIFVLQPMKIYLTNPDEFAFGAKLLFIHLVKTYVFISALIMLFFLFYKKTVFFNKTLITLGLYAILYSTAFTLNTGMLSEFIFQNETVLTNTAVYCYVKDIIIFLLVWLFTNWFLKSYKKYITIILTLTNLFLGICLIKPIIHYENTKSENIIIKQENINNSLPLQEFTATGKNVVVFMADMMNGNYVERFFRENPEQQVKFSGFINFTDCIPITSATKNAFPSLYDPDNFLPIDMNHNNLQYIDEIHQATFNFYKQVIDNNYSAINVNKFDIFKLEGEKINKVETENNFYKNINPLDYMNQWKIENNIPLTDTGKDKTYLISLLPIINLAPLSIKQFVYDDSNWNNIRISIQNMKTSALKYYPYIDYLTKTTIKTYENRNYFYFIDNELTHDPYCFNENGKMINSIDEKSDDMPYNSAKTLLIKLGEWFDYLKENNLYDNTFIVIISDHGNTIQDNELMAKSFPQFDSRLDYKTHLSRVHSAFLYKNFNSTSPYINSNMQVQNIDLKKLLNEYVYQNGNQFSDLEKYNSDYPRVRHYNFETYTKPDYYNNLSFPYEMYEIKGPLTEPASYTYLGVDK